MGVPDAVDFKKYPSLKPFYRFQYLEKRSPLCGYLESFPSSLTAQSMGMTCGIGEWNTLKPKEQSYVNNNTIRT